MNIFLTGATGFLGSHFIYHHKDRFSGIVCLTRSKSAEEALERVSDSYEQAVSSYDKLGVISDSVSAEVGSLEEPLCGVSKDRIALLKNNGIQEFWHFASTLDFEERRKDQIYRQNVKGIDNTVSLAKELGVKRFVYVSTAYTCGKRQGDIEPSMHPLDTDFNNFYEDSKCQAEHIVASLCEEAEIDCKILRPSIVVGPSCTKSYAGSRSGLYGYVRELYRLKNAISRQESIVRLNAKASVRPNFIPIDLLMQDIGQLIENDYYGDAIHHLSANLIIQMQELFSIISDEIELTKVVLADIDGEMSPIEALLDRRNIFYGAYTQQDKNFLRNTKLEEHVVNVDDFRPYVRSIANDLRRDSAESLFDRKVITTSDCLPIKTFSAGSSDLPVILFVNAYGMPADFCKNLADKLKDQFRFITWESRGVPSGERLFENDDMSIDAQLNDIDNILDHYGVDCCHLISWCTGAKVSMEYALKRTNRILSATYINGAFNSASEQHRTEYDLILRDIVPELSENIDFVNMYYNLFYAKKSKSGDNANKSNDINSILSKTDPELIHLTSMPFRDPTNLYNYAKLLSGFHRSRDMFEVEEYETPSLVVSSVNDHVASPRMSEDIADKFDSCEFYMIDNANHFSLHHNADLVAEKFSEFVLNVA